MWAVNLYFWVAAIGFPVIGSHWIIYERKMSKKDYQTGWDDAWEEFDNKHDRLYPDCPWAGEIIE